MKQRKKMESLLGRHLEIRERIFRMILVVGGLADAFALIESLVVVGIHPFVLPLVILLITILASLFLTVKFNNSDFAATIIGVVLSLYVFPTTFLINGGINGGATVWLAINLLYAFFMFSGKRLVFFCVLDCVADCILYYIAYTYPEVVTPLYGVKSVYFDSLFSVLIVGFTIGAMIGFQIHAYEQERKIVNAQRKALEDSSQSKDRFFASMSHELRTPINSIIGLNEMILRQEIDDNVRGYAEDVTNASKMLLSLVNDIIDLSQMELKKMEIVESEYSIKELLKETIRITSVRAEQKNLDFYINIDEKIPAKLMGDKRRIQQILLNILINAIKYTSVGSVSFEVKSERNSDDSVLLTMAVTDTGNGIKKDDLDTLYDAFKRMDVKEHSNIQGSGLGLTITKNLIDLMGGEITVDSIYTKGSTFTVSITQKIVDDTPIGNQEDIWKQNVDSSKEYTIGFTAPEAKVLIVDDNPMNLKVTSELLSDSKVQIETALSGEECLKLTKNNYYHIILLDHIMPGIDGVETLHRVQRQENGLCRESTIIALTANASSSAEAYYTKEGFSAYLEKPLSGRSLEECVMSFLPEELIETDINQEESTLRTIKRLRSKRKKRVVITTDCVSDISPEIMEKLDIDMKYFYIKTPSGRFLDFKEIDSDSLRRYEKNREIIASVETVSVEEYEEFFARNLEKAEYVIHISMGANSGRGYSIAASAAERFDHVKVIDSKHISCGQSLVILKAASMAKDGATVDEIIEEIGDYSERVQTQFIAPNINIFQRNGYASKVEGILYKLLAIKPLLITKKSQITAVGYCLGNLYSARKHFIQRQLRNRRKISSKIIYITYVGLGPEELESVTNEINKYMQFEEVYIQKGSSSSACNVGMGTFGFAFVKE